MNSQKRPVGLIVLSIANFALALWNIRCLVSWFIDLPKAGISVPVLWVFLFLFDTVLLIITGIGIFRVNYIFGFIGTNVFQSYLMLAWLKKIITSGSRATLINLWILYPIAILLLINLFYKKYFILNKPVKEVRKKTPADKPEDKQAERIPGRQTYVKAARLIRFVSWVQVCLITSIILAVLMPVFHRQHDQSGPFPVVIFVCGHLAILSLIVFQFKLSTAIKQHKQWGKTAGIVLGVLWLFGIPIGTVLGSFVLYYLISGWE